MIIMLSRLVDIFTPSTTPSVLLVIGKFGATIRVLHLLPENGTVTLDVGDGVKLRDTNGSKQTVGSSVEVTRLVQGILQPAALDAIHEREERRGRRSMIATQTFPVFIVYISRPKPGRILTTEPTSFP
jgi:hypothetical protein